MKQFSELDFFQLEAVDFLAIRKQTLKSKSEATQEVQYISQLVSRLVSALTPVLNQFHEVNREARYWEILLGCWLSYYSEIIKKHYEFLEKMLRQINQKKIKIMGLNHSDYRVPEDSLDFFYLIQEHPYHLQIYYSLVKAMRENLGLDMEIFKDTNLPDFNPLKNKVAVSKQRMFLSKIFCFIFKKREKILLFSPYLPRVVRIKFFLKSLGAIFEVPKCFFNSSTDHANVRCSKEKRAALTCELKWQPESEFERILGEFIFSDMPMAFLETFKIYQDQAQILVQQFGKVSGVLSAAGSFWGNEVFKQYAALAQEQGAKIYSMQHGGNYGTAVPSVGILHEYSVVDQFFTWGWAYSENYLDQRKFRSMSTSKLIGFPSHFKKNKTMSAICEPGILFPLTSVKAFESGDALSPKQFEVFLEDQCEFLNCLPSDLRAQTLVRPHYEDLSWGIKQKLLSHFPDLNIDTWEQDFLTRLEACQLFICGHLSTTHVEALAMNVPTVLFWRKELFLLSDEAEPYYEELARVGILFYDPKEAAQAVMTIYPNVNQWWGNKERQEAVKNFINKFARRSAEEEEIWYDTLRSLV